MKRSGMSVHSSSLFGVDCPVCHEKCTCDDDLFVHVYIYHPEVSDNISKMKNGEPFETAGQLLARGILTPNMKAEAPK